MDYTVRVGANSLTWNEDELTERLQTIGSLNGRNVCWIKNDLSTSKSNFLTRWFWHFVAKHFNWMRTKLYGVDLEKTKSIFNQLYLQVKKNKLLFPLFEIAIKKFYEIAPRHVDHYIAIEYVKEAITELGFNNKDWILERVDFPPNLSEEAKNDIYNTAVQSYINPINTGTPLNHLNASLVPSFLRKHYDAIENLVIKSHGEVEGAFDFTNERLSFVLGYIPLCSKLKTLKLEFDKDGPYPTLDPSIFEHLDQLDLSYPGYNLKFLRNNESSSLELELDGSELCSRAHYSLEYYPLTRLKLENFKFSDFPIYEKSSNTLKTLELSKCQFKEFPHNIKHLSNLTRMNLDIWKEVNDDVDGTSLVRFSLEEHEQLRQSFHTITASSNMGDIEFNSELMGFD